jgi:hypothetical protein
MKIDEIKYSLVWKIQECSDTIVLENCLELLQRSIIWVKKYGTTLDQNNMEFKERAKYMKEELMDGINYLTRLERC